MRKELSDDDSSDPWDVNERERDYRPLDFDDRNLLEDRFSPELEDEINERLDILEEAEEVLDEGTDSEDVAIQHAHDVLDELIAQVASYEAPDEEE